MKIANNGGKLVPVFVLILAGLGASHVQADVYKWTDKSGTVHYSDQPPAAEAAQRVPGTGIPPDNSEAIKSLADKELEFKKRQEDATKAKDKTDKETEDARIKRQNCENARSKMTQLQSSTRLYTTAPDGSKYYMNAADRQQALDNAQKAVNENCN